MTNLTPKDSSRDITSHHIFNIVECISARSSVLASRISPPASTKYVRFQVEAARTGTWVDTSALIHISETIQGRKVQDVGK
jgi:hypothetical protein